MSKRFLLVAMVLIAVAAFAAGCGGGDDTSDGGDALSKAEFIKQADAICEKGNDAIADEVEKFAKVNDVDVETATIAEQEEVIVGVVLPATQQQLDQIRKLGAPEGDEKEVKAFLDATETGVRALEDDPALLLQRKSPLSEGAKLAKQYGLKTCGE